LANQNQNEPNKESSVTYVLTEPAVKRKAKGYRTTDNLIAMLYFTAGKNGSSRNFVVGGRAALENAGIETRSNSLRTLWNNAWTYRRLEGLRGGFATGRQALGVALGMGEERGAICPECGASMNRHDLSPKRKWRHLDSMGFETILFARIPRANCPEHGVRSRGRISIVASLWPSRRLRSRCCKQAGAWRRPRGCWD